MAMALYARVSTTRQADNELSIPDQLRQIRDWAKRHGVAIAAEYIEPGASAVDDKRPVFQQMIADATRSPAPFEAIVVHSRSRFFRELFHFLHYERVLKKAGVKVISITQPMSDDPAGVMASNPISMFDEYASQENSKHTQRAMRESARQGYWNGSHPPFGYRAAETEITGNRGRKKRRLEVDWAEAEIVRKIYKLYLQGYNGNPMGMKAIASYLNQRGLSMRGSPWRIQKISQILRDPVYAGCFYFNRRDSKTHKLRPQSEWIAVDVPALVSAALFERAGKHRASSNPRMHAPRAQSSPAPLVGLLVCGHCGAGMAQATGKSGRYRYYKCTQRLSKDARGCDSRNLPREKTNALVLQTLSDKVFTPARVSSILKQLIKRHRASRTVEDAKVLALSKELDKVNKSQERLYEAVEEGTLPLDAMLRARRTSYRLDAVKFCLRWLT